MRQGGRARATGSRRTTYRDALTAPEQTVRRMDAIGVARERLEGNVAPLLALEAMAIALRPQG